MPISTTSPLSFSISFRTRWVITINAYRLTWLCSSCNNANISGVLLLSSLFRQFGNLLNRSPTDIIILAFTPKSILDFNKSKTKSKCCTHIYSETHMILHKARMADLSRIQTPGYSAWRFWMSRTPLTVYLCRAVREIFRIGWRNFPRRPSWTSLPSAMSWSVAQYYSISASFPPVIWAKSSSWSA